MVEIKKLPAVFYSTAAGNEPVREWLKALDAVDRRIVGQDIATAEFGWQVGMPVCRSLMVLLHGFIKKTPKTPKPDLDLALKRRKEVTA